MFEGVLYFVLGFLAAALIALMISPAIWNRAVLLTKRRIESSVPLTLNEVQADKDQLRAEFAMSTRRLELSIEELREKASQQVIEINRKRDELAKLASESGNKIKFVEELESRGADLRQLLLQREDELEQKSKELADTRQKLEERAIDLERIKRELNDTRSDADSRRIELVAKQTSLDDLSDRSKNFTSEIEKLRSETEMLKSRLQTAESANKDSNQRLERLQKTNADLEDKLQRREKNVSQLRSESQADSESSNELTRLLMEERQKTTQLEADLAKSVLRMEALLTDASNENVSKAIKTLSGEKAELRAKLKELTTKSAAMEKQLAAYKDNSGAQWEQERKDNAVLRERINDLAAQVTAMTASIEGPNSPINEIIRKAEADGKKSKSVGEGSSLADRVRALQETARVKQA